MKVKIVFTVALVAILALVFASSAMAVSQSTINKIIKDAQDGTIDGTYTAAEIQAALDFISSDPLATDYSQVKDTLQSFLASLQAPGAKSGELAFTGAPLLLIIAGGLTLIGGGFALRRRYT